MLESRATRIKNRLLSIAGEIEQMALDGANKADWDRCVSVMDELLEHRQCYVALHHTLSFAFTKQNCDEIEKAIDKAALKMQEARKRLEVI